jgi:1,4-alpha-glucan branching enzyme
VISSENNASGTASVTFTITHAGLEGRRLAVVGDFNGWDPGADPMEYHDGTYTKTITLDPGRYRFRYLGEDGQWFNDDAAHGYEDNDHGGHDSILDLAPTHPADPEAATGEHPDSTTGPSGEPQVAAELELAVEQDRAADRELRTRAKLPRSPRARTSTRT